MSRRTLHSVYLPQPTYTMVYHVYQDLEKQWRWRLLSPNNRIIASCGEGYDEKTACLASIDLVKSSLNAVVVED